MTPEAERKRRLINELLTEYREEIDNLTNAVEMMIMGVDNELKHNIGLLLFTVRELTLRSEMDCKSILRGHKTFHPAREIILECIEDYVHIDI